VDRGKGGCQQAATHKVNRSTRAGAAELAETRRVSRINPSILPIALPAWGNIMVRRLVLYATTFGT
jgi:hypothetical protein